MSSAPRPVLLSIAAIAAASLLGCDSSKPAMSSARHIDIGDFANPPADLKADVIEMSPEVVAGPEELIVVEELDVKRRGAKREAAAADKSAKLTEARGVVAEQLADGETAIDAVSPDVTSSRVKPGETWPVDALVGQINGRPIFADAFLEPIADRLVQAAAMPDRVSGRRVFLDSVQRTFKDTVDSELIVAEAESQLSPEQQQGLFAWLRTIKEETIAQRGGSRALAEASLEAEKTQSLEQFMQERRDVALAGRLLNQRVRPRAIVSWREVVQAYERDRKIYSPPQQIKIGRIRFDTQTDADKIEKVKAMVADGKKFSEIVAAMGIADGGLWQSEELPESGIAGLQQLSDGVRTRLTGLDVDKVSEPLQQRDFLSWFTVISLEKPPSRSIYDRDVQLTITERLRAIRETVERDRYINSLRTRWVTDDINEMYQRLEAFALDRYWR